MDIEDIKYSLVELERYSYRVLQQIAKPLGLPSNVKKKYLIEMIYTKKFKPEEELNAIIQKVKRERQQISQGRKRVARKRTYLQVTQGTEISSTSNSLSPPISMTPKRTGRIVIRCSPENIRQAIAKYNSRQTHLTRSSTAVRKTYPSPKKSDRILRSFNIKANNAKIEDNSRITSTKTSNIPSNSYGSISSVYSVLRHPHVKETQEQRFPKTITENMVKKYNPVYRHTYGLDPERTQLIPITRNAGTNSMVPARRQRILSGIYPLVSKEQPKINYEYVQSQLRHRDGKISKIHAIVQKRSETPIIEVTVQDIINKSVGQTLSNPYVNTESSTSLTYSNINRQNETNKYLSSIDQRNERYDTIDQRNERFGNTDSRNDNTENRNERYGDIDDRLERYGNLDRNNERQNGNAERDEQQYSIYYHKKIRGEQVRSQKSYQREVSRDADERLPKIDSVFSRFNVHTDVTQPIYVQVSDESERFQSHPQYTSITSTTPLLEQIYNFRSGFLVNQPLQSIPTTATTNCVYSTPIIATAVAQPTSLVPDYINTQSKRDNYYSDLAGFPRICELLKFGEQENLRRDFRCDEVLSPCSSQDLGASVTIPEMVEDALELISQDGDYMERIGMDVRMQCVLCPFVCPKFLLEYHIRKEHSKEIHHQEHSSWSMSLPLRSLTQLRNVTVLSHDAALFVLTVDYRLDTIHTAIHEHSKEIYQVHTSWSMSLPLRSLTQLRNVTVLSHDAALFVLTVDYRLDTIHTAIHEYSKEIYQVHTSWSMSLPLRSLTQFRNVTVLSHDAALFVLTVDCRLDTIHTTIHSFVTDSLPKNGSITIYNKVSGEPYTWEGEIQTIPNDFTDSNITDGLSVDVSKLDLLPNSANLKLLNGRLVLKSPTKVVIGHPDLDDIHVILFVKIND